MRGRSARVRRLPCAATVLHPPCPPAHLHADQEGQEGELDGEVVRASVLGHALHAVTRLVDRRRQLQSRQALQQEDGQEAGRVGGRRAVLMPSLRSPEGTHRDGLVDVDARRVVEPLVKGGQR